jgi:hypothetical protein
VTDDVHMDGVAEDIRLGKDYSAETPPHPAAVDAHATNGSKLSNSPDQNDDHAQTRADEVAPHEQDSTTGHDRLTDDTYREAMDDHGEEVVEAAEDTVMY